MSFSIRRRRTPQGVRGLKYAVVVHHLHRLLSHPARGAWIEMTVPNLSTQLTGSHPARGAWIEIAVCARIQSGAPSHPARGAWIEISEDQAIAARQQTRRSGLAEQIAQYPARLQAYTPDKLKAALEADGYEIHPLARGKLKGVRFEDGGGFRVNFSDGGLLQYHPDQGSHHDGAYYKISTGTKGVIRYDIDGKRKKI